MAKPVRPQYLLLISLSLAWIFDFLFWRKVIGISVPIFTFLIVGIGLWMARRARLQPAWGAIWLLAPIAFFSFVPMFRLEPFTRFISMAVLFLLLALFALSFLGGEWIRYGFADYIVRILGFVPSGLGLLKEKSKATLKKNEAAFGIRSLAPVLRGLLFALPLLWFLAVLLASADPTFADWLDSVFSFLNIDNAAEYLFRGFYILILAYILSAAYLVALNKSRKEKLLGEDEPLVTPILGFGETATMMTAVILLFLAFVIFQFNYFFGGTTNIIDTPTGFTYSEYAVRGFWELLVVSITSLAFFLALSVISKRGTIPQQRWFSGLGIGLFLLVAVILTSSFQRLLLYERVYGFTRLRTYPHVFMIWLGLLLLAIVVLETLGRQRSFALATLLAVVGFSATLALINVDALIVRNNVKLALNVEDFDFAYLASLSDDAVPAMISSYWHAVTVGEDLVAEQLAAGLACHYAIQASDSQPRPWQSWIWSEARAINEWTKLRSEANFPNMQVSDDKTIALAGQERSCFTPFWD
ncbi:MAG: DUF4173 domain-containing protein [Chloroflexi bacterium]|nr:DUF4173 domain-containing protein [Chloroflexota bacterium]